MEIAKEILRQLGGNRFTMMTGSKNYAADQNSLRMNLTRNKLKAKYLKITLTSMDDYTLEFFSMGKNFNKIVKSTINGVYCDQLQTIFTEQTGLYTKL